MLLGIQDEAYRYGRYYKYVFRKLHINPRRIRLSYRSSLAAIGYVGRRRPYWIRYMSRSPRRGPSYVTARIPIYGGEYMNYTSMKRKFIFKCSVLYTVLKTSGLCLNEDGKDMLIDGYLHWSRKNR